MREFYATRADAESVAEFIRIWRNRYGNADAPLYLAGESFGVTRAANVADVLESRDTRVRGVVLMGLEPPIGHISDTMRVALLVPSFTVAALTHGKLAPDLQRDVAGTMRQSEQWSRAVFADAFSHVAALTDSQRDSVVRTLSRFTGLPVSAIDPRTFVIPYPASARHCCAPRESSSACTTSG
jgi:carboxypeptidase C (cathepsin A)